MKDYTQFTDEELIDMLRQGEPDVMDYIIDKYKSMVRKKARVLYLVGGDQDDLIQEGMIGLFKAVRDYRKEKDASFRTFAQLCVDRQLYHAIQSSNRQKHQPLNSYVSINSEEWEEEVYNIFQQSPENIVIAQENAAPTARISPSGLMASLDSLQLIRQIPAMATKNPIKKFTRSFSSFLKKICARTAVKNGATEVITPTLDAIVKVSAIFSRR